MTTIQWNNDKRRLGDLVPWPRNPRQIREPQAKRLVESFGEFGQVETLAIGPDNEIYNGHQRLNALRAEHGADYMVDVRVSSRPLTEREREKLTVLLHKGAAGEWDFDVLANEFDLGDLLDWGFEPVELGIDTTDPPEPGDAEPQVNRAEELREEWGVEPGQMWRLPSRTEGQEHRLICGDCTDAAVVDRVMGNEKAQACVTDPPFNVRQDEWDKFDDFFLFTRSWMAIAYQSAPIVAAFFADKFLPLLAKAAEAESIPFRRSLIWVKPPGSQYAGGQTDGFWYDFELIQVYGEPAVATPTAPRFSVFDYRTVTGQEHGAEKPPGLYADAWRNYSERGGAIYEPFSGTGSNLVACENEGRQCRAIDKGAQWVAVALQRYQDAFGIAPELIDNLTV